MQQLTSSIISSPLGSLIAIADDEALYLLEFIDGKRKRLPATISGTTDPIQSIEAELHQYFKSELTAFKTPIALQGSPFQNQVWAALQKIPYGETRSYAELAASIGKPTAYRAVANANGANPLAIIIPCHRVIHSNGELGGYAGGIAKKDWMLQLEKRV